MMRFLLIVQFFLIAPSLFGQAGWIKRAGGASTDLANGLWTDTKHQIFVTGSFSGQAKFHKTEVFCRGGGDVFVTKYNPEGIPIWVRTYGGRLDDFANAITGDPEGNLYLTGVFTDTAYFDGEPLFSKGPDVFVLKLNPKGQLIWVRNLGTLGSAIPQSIAVTDQGGVYVGGLFSGQFNMATPRQMGQTDGFVTKLTWDGEYSWTKVLGGPGFDEVNLLKTDAWGRVVAAGVFDQTMWVEDQELVGMSSKSAFVVRMEATGALQWANNFTGSDAGVLISDAACDLDGNVFLTGKFSVETTFETQSKVSKGQSDLFLCRLGPKGSLEWVSDLGGPGVEEAIAVQLSPDGKNLIVAGFFNSLLEYGKRTLQADFENQFFLSRWDLRGNLDEIRKQDFHSSFQCAGRRLSALGQVWLCGSFSDKVNFGKADFVSAGEEDVFLVNFQDSRIVR